VYVQLILSVAQCTYTCKGDERGRAGRWLEQARLHLRWRTDTHDGPMDRDGSAAAGAWPLERSRAP